MSPKTYSNGAERLDAGDMLVSGTHITADLRMEDGFFSCESGFLDAPMWMAAGAMQRGVTRGDTPASIPAITFRRE